MVDSHRGFFVVFNYVEIIVAPKGASDNRASLNDCFAKGMPIMVMAKAKPTKKCPIAKGIPLTSNHTMLNKQEMGFPL